MVSYIEISTSSKIKMLRSREEFDKVEPIEVQKSKSIIRQPHGDTGLLPKHPFRLLVSGGSMSGKTTLVNQLLTNEKYGYVSFFNKIVLVSPNAFGEQWERVSEILGEGEDGKITRFDEFKNDYFMALLDFLKQEKETSGEFSPRVLIVFDDCLDDSKLVHSQFLKALFTRGRHAGISSIFITQAFNQFPLALRKQLSNVIVYPTFNQQEIDALHKDFGHARLSKQEFFDLFRLATAEQYSFLHINNQALDKSEVYRKRFTEILQIVK